ncbi:MurR/RpiR family transcriptional regulator [Anaerococcus sp. AGMB00486]|uniref:MurR/RpiR family transcriptional regulator n=1 Tax=Anaerococcus faecalis TaxID=2742993 RepID=A0ABX2NAT2_9FIRM|nr:SIS domain-containing protein [Anaerococcus faecalis]NVF11811.1 MurR/RpiR family transcriptional regulator [Anaerococcus faecalis]
MDFFDFFKIKYNDKLNSSDKEILKYLENNVNAIPNSTLSQMSELAFTSNSTLYRLIRKLGFDSYNNFKFEIKKYLNLECDDSLFYKIVNSSITETEQLINKDIEKVAELILNAERLYIYPTGWKQTKITENFIVDLQSYSLKFQVIRDINEFSNIKNIKKSLLMIISYSGDTFKYAKEIEDLILNRNIIIIGISINRENELKNISDYCLQYSSIGLEDESGHWNTLSLEYLLERLINKILHN